MLDWARQQAFQLRRWLPDRPPGSGWGRSLCCLGLPGAICEPLPSFASRVCASTPGFMNPPLHRVRAVALTRPPIKGLRLPSLQQRLADPKTRWSKRTSCSTGMAAPNVESSSAREQPFGITAVSHQPAFAGCSSVIPEKRFDPIALLSTDPVSTPLDIITFLRAPLAG